MYPANEPQNDVEMEIHSIVIEAKYQYAVNQLFFFVSVLIASLVAFGTVFRQYLAATFQEKQQLLTLPFVSPESERAEVLLAHRHTPSPSRRSTILSSVSSQLADLETTASSLYSILHFGPIVLLLTRHGIRSQTVFCHWTGRMW